MKIRPLLMLILSAVCSLASASSDHTQAHTLPVGSYRLQVSEESKSLAQLAGEPIPVGSLSITETHQFVLDTNIGRRLTHREGRLEADGDEMTLTFGEELHMKGKVLDDGSLDISGMKFSKRETGSIIGIWHVKKMNASLEFLPDGNFKFKCTGATSTGTYRLEGGVITLTWTTVDGEPVDADTMHKRLLVDDEGSFWIDNYHYHKE